MTPALWMEVATSIDFKIAATVIFAELVWICLTLAKIKKLLEKKW